ncbi:MAG: hypothetical protein ACT4QE_05255, partial [Anaerolineales bacterium]
DQLANLGAELVWVNIGHLDAEQNVDRQRLETWQSFWQSHDSVTWAHGEALRVAYEELGRAEGQAAMLQAILGGLQTGLPEGRINEQAIELALLQIGHVLESMTAREGLSGRNSTQADPAALPIDQPAPSKAPKLPPAETAASES